MYLMGNCYRKVEETMKRGDIETSGTDIFYVLFFIQESHSFGGYIINPEQIISLKSHLFCIISKDIQGRNIEYKLVSE